MEAKRSCIRRVSGDLRPQSPLSQTRHSRMVEKVELQSLNDRLACYIDRVRFLEVENSRLRFECQAIVESHNEKKTSIKHIFESELTNIRKSLDENSIEKTRLEIEISRLHEENTSLKTHLQRKAEELSVAQSFELKYNEMQAKCNVLEVDHKRTLNINSELEKEIVNLKSSLEDLRKHLEEETLARVETENKAQTLREEIALSAQMAVEPQETRIMTKCVVNASEEYEAKLERTLHQLRDQYETLMRANRLEVDTLYKAKIDSLQAEAARASASAAGAMEEIQTTRNQISSLNAKISEIEGQASGYLSRIRDLESMLDDSTSQRGKDQAEIRHLREEMTRQVQEYQDLMDIKVSLDLEIAAYNGLLTGEEERHKRSYQPAHSSQLMLCSNSTQDFHTATSMNRKSISRCVKRKRLSPDVEGVCESRATVYLNLCDAKGDLEIQEACPEGKFVRIYNKGDSEIAIGGWQLKRTAGENETVFKFRRSIIIEPKTSITVWSADTSSKHEPPTNIVMKKNWIASEISKTKLFNADHEEMAKMECKPNSLNVAEAQS